MSTMNFKEIFQTKINATVATTMFTNPSSTQTIIYKIRLVNNDASSRTYTLYKDNDGTTYDTTTQITKTRTVLANDEDIIEGPIILHSTGNLAIAQSSANAFTVTGEGQQIT